MSGTGLIDLEFAAAGGNRHPSAADWAAGLLAFGAGCNIALWDPDGQSPRGVTALLAGHTDDVNAVKICDIDGQRLILSGGSDNTIRVWKSLGSEFPFFREVVCLSENQGSINTISVLPECGIFAAGSADGTVKVWSIQAKTEECQVELLQKIHLNPRYIPLTSALVALGSGQSVLAIGGTHYAVQLFSQEAGSRLFELQATLTGHEGWIRSLDFTRESGAADSDVLLASASQDKYIRLWRFHKHRPAANRIGTATGHSLSNKVHEVGVEGDRYVVTFEALLIGHEDWIYTAKWAPRSGDSPELRLLSASADNSLSIWMPDAASGVWVSMTRLGEISAQKGSTTATGSAGGFWIGLWQPQGLQVVSLGRTGSWRRWAYSSNEDMWSQTIGIGGHVDEVRSLAWSPDGSYLLSVGSDQTTRLFAKWTQGGEGTWHEISRAQIHGYDLNCVDSVTNDRFISGADEKLLRVFDKPRTIDNLLHKVCGTAYNANEALPDAANIPVLGLSNKAIATVDDDEQVSTGGDPDRYDRDAVDPASVVHKSTLDFDHPPLEDHLARHTLWPEHEKLYGHGYEISAVAASNDGSVVATACKASSIDHAVIRLYETNDWREVRPSLSSHNLTITSMAFSPDDEYLLSVGRDRQWAVFARDSEVRTQYTLLAANPKGHSRMILDCAWLPSVDEYIFATAGRDKSVKIWRLDPVGRGAELVSSVTGASSITAVAFRQQASNSDVEGGGYILAVGSEDGSVAECAVRTGKEGVQTGDVQQLARPLCPSKSISRLAWRPGRPGQPPATAQLAVASEDGSLRLLSSTSADPR